MKHHFITCLEYFSKKESVCIFTKHFHRTLNLFELYYLVIDTFLIEKN